jgi:hypothetical protein
MISFSGFFRVAFAKSKVNAAGFFSERAKQCFLNDIATSSQLKEHNSLPVPSCICLEEVSAIFKRARESLQLSAVPETLHGREEQHEMV